MKKIIWQVLALTKKIWLVPPPMEPGFKHQFSPGRGRTIGFVGGFFLTWWYTHATFRSVENIAFMMAERIAEFRNLDQESIVEAVNTTIKQLCIDRRLFDPDTVCFARKNTLFDCKGSIETDRLGIVIFEEIVANLKSQLVKRCTIYAAPRISGPSFFIEGSGLGVIAKADDSAWNNLLSAGYEADGWSPQTGTYSGGRKTPFAMVTFDYIFVCEELGTAKGTTFDSALKLRMLLAVIFALVSENRTLRLLKSGGDPYTFCLQFSVPGESIIFGSFGKNDALIPYYINELVISPEDIINIQNWYRQLVSISSANKNRIEKCAHFINRAMNADGVEAYISYFVALDALFGRAGAVEDSILAGVNSLCLDSSMPEKASKLYELRNELVHGGSRFIKEWPKYQRYYRHFETRPEQDIEKLAFSALARAPKLFT